MFNAVSPRLLMFGGLIALMLLPAAASAQYMNVTMFYRPNTHYPQTYVIQNGSSSVYEWPIQNTVSQKWSVVSSGSPGLYFIKSTLDGKCLESVGTGFPVYMMPCGGWGGQLWRFTIDPWSASMPPEMRIYPYMIRNFATNACLYVESGFTVYTSTSQCSYDITFLFGDGRTKL